MVFSWQKGLFRSFVEQQEVSPFISLLSRQFYRAISQLVTDQECPSRQQWCFLSPPRSLLTLGFNCTISAGVQLSTEFMHQGFYDIYRTGTSNVPHMTDEMCLQYSKSQGNFLKVKSTKKVSFGGNNLIQKILGNKTYEMCIFCPTYVKAEGSLLDWSKPFHPPFDFLARCFLKLPPDPKAKHRKIIADVLSYPLQKADGSKEKSLQDQSVDKKS